jgi:transposase
VTPHETHVVIEARAQGETVRAIADRLDVSKSAVHRCAQANRERIDAMREELQGEFLERARARSAEWIETRIDDAANPESRTGAQSARVLLEGCGLAGKGAVNVFGDVNVAHVTISEERKQIILSESPEERDARMAELARQLGIA